MQRWRSCIANRSWRQGQETHQLFLDADGQLLANTDFERRLSYVCEWRSAGGEDVDGSASFQAHAGKVRIRPGSKPRSSCMK